MNIGISLGAVIDLCDLIKQQHRQQGSNCDKCLELGTLWHGIL